MQLFFKIIFIKNLVDWFFILTFVFVINKTYTMKAISKVIAVELINKSRGRIFTVTYKKKDNSIRVMNCRLGVNKGINGSGMAYNPTLKGMKPVFDMQVKEWRMLNLETIKYLTIDKQQFIVL